MTAKNDMVTELLDLCMTRFSGDDLKFLKDTYYMVSFNNNTVVYLGIQQK